MAHMENVGRRSLQELADASLKRGDQQVGPRLERWLPLAIAIAILVIWEAGGRLGVIPALFFPAPSTIAGTMGRLIANGKLPTNLGATLFRMLSGLVLGGSIALVLGLAMGASSRLRALIDPFIAATYPIPKLAVFPLIMIIFGIGETSKLIVIALSTFFPMLINTVAGVRQISPIYLEVADNYGANLFQIFTRVTLPGSLPMVLAGLRLAFNTSLLITIAVELVAAQKGIGAMIWLAWETLRTEELYASLFVVVTMGIGFNWLLNYLTARLVPWQVERETGRR